eukprot:4922049-Amphidinium_carterae.1
MSKIVPALRRGVLPVHVLLISLWGGHTSAVTVSVKIRNTPDNPFIYTPYEPSLRASWNPPVSKHWARSRWCMTQQDESGVEKRALKLQKKMGGPRKAPETKSFTLWAKAKQYILRWLER